MSDLEILYQDSGRFDRRFPVGPAHWPHFDLLWLHEGAVRLKLGPEGHRLDLVAPAGVLIYPDVPFRGVATTGFATASVCHFTKGPFASETGRVFRVPPERDALHVQNLIRLSLEHKSRGSDMAVRCRLLRSILDCFADSDASPGDEARVQQAWDYAARRLADIRGLPDVAAGIGLSESSFRALHRRHFPEPAGRHLQQMRLGRAENLLATTGLGVQDIARAVGYAHPESFSAAFTRSRGKTPGQYRRWCKRLA